jgi:hypothetical protein
MIAKSISFSARWRTMAPRLLTVSWISTPGWRRRNSASSEGREILCGTDHADFQPSGLDALECRQRLAGLAQLFGNAPCLARHFLAGGREPHFLARLLGQRQAGLILQRLHLHRHRRLGQVQFLGGARKGQVARHRLEDLELAQGDVLHGDRFRKDAEGIANHLITAIRNHDWNLWFCPGYAARHVASPDLRR